MKAFRITETGAFMSGLLSGNAFDAFLMEEASIHMAVLWQTDGHLNRDFYTGEEWEDRSVRPYDLAQWEEVRPYFRSIIKGTKVPSFFRFVLHLKPEKAEALLRAAHAEDASDNLAAMVLTIRYDQTGVTLVTGVSVRTFTVDRTPEKVWDEAMQAFLAAKEMSFEPL